MIHGKLPFMRKTSTVKFRSILAGAIAGSLFYIIGYPLLPLALGNYLMPLSLSDMEFTTLVDVLPIFVNSFAIVFPLSLAIGAIVGLISVLMYGQVQVYAKNRLRTRFGLNDKHSSV
jgi:xanthine/uracil/vitamin C permease (AzgA family)